MRLGQLARKLAVRPLEIVDFLARQQIHIEENSNSKIEDNQVVLIMQHFDPSGVIALSPEPEPGPVKDTVESPVDEVAPEGGDLGAESSVTESDKTEEESGEPEKIEVIRAPKVELSGLKVLGKIELPELKKKELPNETTNETPVPESEPLNKPRLESRRSSPPRRQSYPAPRKNPIALQREREAREAEEKRKTQIELEKEKRALHYQKKMNLNQPVKAVKKTVYDEPVEETAIPAKPIPKTWWGKFMRWLNT